MPAGRIVWLEDPACCVPEAVGRKAATLAHLKQRGHPVPGGFCVPVDSGEDAWRDDVRQALQRLAAPWVARSSATVEDAPGRTFAGVFTTILGIPNAKALLEAVVRVRASADSAAAIAYAARCAVQPGEVHMAVLVQTLVAADVAGVVFGRHPVTGADAVSVEANYGLGATVVDGSVTPDSWTIDPDGEIAERLVGSKREKLVGAPDGVRRVQTPALERTMLCLTDEQVLRVAALVRRLGSDLGCPVDAEWAYRADELVVLQARPITAIGERTG